MQQRTFFYTFLLMLPVFGYAQYPIFEDHTNEIAAFESKRFFNYREKAERTGAEIDVVYSRFFWEVDPGVLFIQGHVTSYFKSKVGQLTEINLELNNNMVIDSILFRDEKVAHQYYSDFQFTIFLSHTLELGVLDSLTIFYHGVPIQGSGFGSFSIDEHEGVPVLWTLSEPYGAKDWWPGKNDLIDKIDSIDVIVKSPKQYRTASHGLLVSEIVEGDYKTCHWKHRYPIVSYLVAFALTNYVEFTQYAVVDGDSVPIVNYVYPEDSAYFAWDSENTPEMIHLFDSLFGAYPFADEKYGHAQFSQGGGMEHQTMSFMQGLGHDLRAHELAHSWFGNKITLASWHDIFLNEGFATYSTGLSFENMYDGYWWDIWKSNTRNAAMMAPDGSVYVEDTTDVSRIFSGRLSYNKGACLLHMLRWIMGDEAFFSAVRNYISDPMLAFRFATVNDLKAHLESSANMDFTEFFADWYYGEGYPIYSINVAQLEEDGKIYIAIFQEQSHPSVDFFEMPVPIVLYGQGSEISYRCENTYSGQEYVYEFPGFKVDSAKFDPGQWLLAKLGFFNLGFNDMKTRNIAIHPNPASESIQFFIRDIQIQRILIYNFSGKVVFEKPVKLINEKIDVNVSGLANGFYLLKAETAAGSFRGKFVKR